MKQDAVMKAWEQQQLSQARLSFKALPFHVTVRLEALDPAYLELSEAESAQNQQDDPC